LRFDALWTHFTYVSTLVVMAGNYGKLPDLSNFSPEFIAFTNAPTLLSQAGALFGAAALVVLLRFYVRVAILRSFGKDDWIMLLGFAFAMAVFLVYVMETKVGLGRHLAVIQSDPASYSQFLRLRQVHGILLGIGVGLVKVSIAFFLLRFVTLNRYRWFLHGLNIFMVLFTTACAFTLGKILFAVIRQACANVFEVSPNHLCRHRH